MPTFKPKNPSCHQEPIPASCPTPTPQVTACWPIEEICPPSEQDVQYAVENVGGVSTFVPIVDDAGTDDQTASEVLMASGETVEDCVTANKAAIAKISDTDDQTAAEVPVVDAGDYYVGDNTEDILQEIGAGCEAKQAAIDVNTAAIAAIHADDDVETVTGTAVDNTDPRNPIINLPVADGPITGNGSADSPFDIDFSTLSPADLAALTAAICANPTATANLVACLVSIDTNTFGTISMPNPGEFLWTSADGTETQTWNADTYGALVENADGSYTWTSADGSTTFDIPVNVSADAGNIATAGADGGVLITALSTVTAICGDTASAQALAACLISGDNFNTIQAGTDGLLWSSSVGNSVTVTDPTDTATWPAIDPRFAIQPVLCDGCLVGWLTRQGPIENYRSETDRTHVLGSQQLTFTWLEPDYNVSLSATTGERSYTNTTKFPQLVLVDGKVYGQILTGLQQVSFYILGTVNMLFGVDAAATTNVRGQPLRSKFPPHNDLGRPGLLKSDRKLIALMKGSVTLQPGETLNVAFSVENSNQSNVENSNVRHVVDTYVEFKAHPAGKGA